MSAPHALPPRSLSRARSSLSTFVAALSLVACTTGSGETLSPGSPVGTTSAAPVASNTTPSASSPVVTGSEPLFAGMPPEVNVPDASSEPDVSDAPLLTCIPSSGPGEDLLIDDFEDGNDRLQAREGRSGVWYSYEQSPGDHQLSFPKLDSPRLGSTRSIFTSGSDHGEWAGVGVTLSGCVYDASPYRGVHFWVRGESAPIYVALITPGVVPYSQGGTCTGEDEGLCWDAYRSRIEVTGQWREVFLPFSTFAQLGYGVDAGDLDLTRLQAIQFQSNPGAFELWIDDLAFYMEEVYTPYEAGLPPEPSGDAGVPQEAGAELPDAASVSPDASTDGGRQ